MYLVLEADSVFYCIYPAYITSQNNKALHKHFCLAGIRPNYIHFSLQKPFRCYRITNSLISVYLIYFFKVLVDLFVHFGNYTKISV